ncbi:hypothetical protein C4572_02040 [Candidatus Parcubacteria bacterium]|nr:MAG: hypothetical protein C4572_02040 [Candidatus Parcubacteria bacterium]
MSNFSLIIKNGLVYDGKGNKPVKTDLGIADDEIKKAGDLSAEAAQNIIDAAGKCVAPGFIDITSHSDTHWTIFNNPGQESLISQGITTIIGGNCGSSLAPFLGESSAKEIERWVDSSKININWQTMKEFLAEMENHKLGLNFGTFVGLNTIRRSIIADKQRIAKIKMLLKSSLEGGAFGMTTNFGLSDLGFFEHEELVEIFNILAPYHLPVKHHLEDEGQNLLPAISKMISAARESKTKMHISHFKALGRGSWESFAGALRMMQTARSEGISITYDFFPYTKTGSSLFALLPQWFRKYSPEEATRILSSGQDKRRQDLKDFLKKMTLHYDRIVVASAKAGFSKLGKTIKELSLEAGMDTEEVILNLLEMNDLRVSIFNEVISEENIRAIAADDYSAVSSDGVGQSMVRSAHDLPHPRSAGAFPRVISEFSREKNLLPMEKAIHKMTGLPAQIIGIKDRGVIGKNAKADIVIFDPEKIKDLATYENPFLQAAGIEHVIINGKSVVSFGKLAGIMPGKVLRNR